MAQLQLCQQAFADPEIAENQGVGEHIAGAIPGRLDAVDIEVAYFDYDFSGSDQGVFQFDSRAEHK